MLFETVKAVLILSVLIAGSVSDVRRREVRDAVPCAVSMIALAGSGTERLPDMIAGGAMLFGIMLVMSLLSKDGGAGGADIKISGAVGLSLGAPFGLMWLLFSLAIALTVSPLCQKIRKKTGRRSAPKEDENGTGKAAFEGVKKEGIPLFPYFAAGYAAVAAVSVYIRYIS